MTQLLEEHARTSLREPADRRWSREEYYRLAQQGYFQGQRVELIEGRIVQMPAQGLPHTQGVELVDLYVRSAFPKGHRFRIQMPFRAFDGSDPEPDVAVILGNPRDPMEGHPTSAVLIVEVGDTTLRHDRHKARMYAASGIQDYWIVNLLEGTIEVHRDPIIGHPSAPAPCESVQSLTRSDSIAPLAACSSVLVSELLP